MPSLCNSKKKFVFDLLTRQYDMLKDKTEPVGGIKKPPEN